MQKKKYNNNLTAELLDRLVKELKKANKIIEPTVINKKHYYVTGTLQFAGRIRKNGNLDMRYSMTVIDALSHTVWVHVRKNNKWKWLKSA